jgi:hypothetical protein
VRRTQRQPLPDQAKEDGVNFKTFLVVLLFVILLAGATGGSESARSVGVALNQGVHWIADAWNALVGSG